MTADNTKKKVTALLSISALARHLGIGRTTVYEWLYSQQLPPPAKIINKRRYWTKKQIESFLETGLK